MTDDQKVDASMNEVIRRSLSNDGKKAKRQSLRDRLFGQDDDDTKGNDDD